MIFITGDCHSDFHKFNHASFPEQTEMNREDCVIICGDFGGVWEWKESDHEKWWLNWLEDRTFTTLFVDGNHENYDRLAEYPIEEWNGGQVHVIRPHVLHLMRGEIFIINGCRIFSFGGARSHDINGGVFEPDDPILKKRIKWAYINEKPYRINHRSWWREEMPNEEEMRHGTDQLQKNGNIVDYIVSHECPASALELLPYGVYECNELNLFFEKVKNETQYKRWFFGHYHIDLQVSERDICLYDQIIRIW